MIPWPKKGKKKWKKTASLLRNFVKILGNPSKVGMILCSSHIKGTSFFCHSATAWMYEQFRALIHKKYDPSTGLMSRPELIFLFMNLLAKNKQKWCQHSDHITKNSAVGNTDRPFLQKSGEYNSDSKREFRTTGMKKKTIRLCLLYLNLDFINVS